ncbi:hypothetical protein SLS56_001731 [Neofusicoccum ribis]|uniref:Xylanolytic transcriptional activator regulatory domain-containing protein n=1 Tax=Neofusicoccum ribis TaxID=45134 RepID=A0ABR3T6W3_9PEZI
MESILKSAGIISHSQEKRTDSSLDTRIRNLLDATNAEVNLPRLGRQETQEGQKVLIDHWRLAGLPAPLFCHDTSKNLMQQMLDITSIDNVDRDMFSSTAFTPLPPREEVYAVVDDYFVHSNSMLPLYHRLTFMRNLDRYYSGELYGRSGWWASLNTVLAVSCMLRARTPRKALFFEDQEVRAWAYMKNAMSVYSELAMVNVDLFSAQALIGMSKSYANVNPVGMEQRRRIFWIAYTYDKEFGLRSGQPLMQVDDDVDIDLPTEQPNYPMGCATTNLGLVPKDGEFSIFRGKCTLAVIKSKIYQRLYSAQSWRKTKKEISATVAQLTRELDDWKATLPYALHPDHNMGNLPPSFMIFALSMRFAYYHRVTALHRRLWAYHQTENNPPDALGSDTSPSDPQLVRSAQSCVQAARQTIQLLQILPEWEVFYQ